MRNNKYISREEYEIEQSQLDEIFITKEEMQQVLIRIKYIEKKLEQLG